MASVRPQSPLMPRGEGEGKFPGGFPGRAWHCLRAAQPVLARQSVDPPELPLVVGDHGVPQRLGLGRDQQVVAADGRAGLLQLCPDGAVGFIRSLSVITV